MRRFNRALGELNVVLAALAIGLTILDVTCFIAFTAIAEIRRPNQPARQVQLSLPKSWPEWFQPPLTPELTSAALRTAESP
jgi:hypothetical protein